MHESHLAYFHRHGFSRPDLAVVLRSHSSIGKAENPRGVIELVLLRCMSCEARDRDLKRAVKLDFPLKVQIMTAGDERDCECVQKYNGLPFALDEVPVLPLDRCDAAHCRCLSRVKPQI